jgi:hypothetical protein
MAALEQASKENYLGDPKVVSKILSDFSAEALQHRASGMSAEKANFCDLGYALALADVFLGKVPNFAPMIPWNSPGQIDRWLETELREENVASESPEMTVAKSLNCYLKHIFSIYEMPKNGVPDGQWEWNIDATLENFTNVMLGVSIRDDEPTEEDDDEL